MGGLLSSHPSEATTVPPDEILRKAESFRNEASQLMSQGKSLSKQSQDEYKSGCRSQAKVLSIEKTRLYQQATERNRQAAQLFFEHFNRDRAKDIIDLHGLSVAEALEYLQQRINQCRAGKISRLTVITGMGNNSPDNIAKIKPEVEKFAKEHQLKVMPCGGSIVIDLTGEANTSRCVIQ